MNHGQARLVYIAMSMRKQIIELQNQMPLIRAHCNACITDNDTIDPTLAQLSDALFSAIDATEKIIEAIPQH